MKHLKKSSLPTMNIQVLRIKERKYNNMRNFLDARPSQ